MRPLVCPWQALRKPDAALQCALNTPAFPGAVSGLLAVLDADEPSRHEGRLPLFQKAAPRQIDALQNPDLILLWRLGDNIDRDLFGAAPAANHKVIAHAQLLAMRRAGSSFQAAPHRFMVTSLRNEGWLCVPCWSFASSLHVKTMVSPANYGPELA